MEAYIAPLISAAALVLVAIIETRNNKARKKSDARANLRAEESRLSMEMMSATCALSLVVAKKVTGMHTNGDVKEAMDKAGDAQAEYAEFVRTVASKQVCKT